MYLWDSCPMSNHGRRGLHVNKTSSLTFYDGGDDNQEKSSKHELKQCTYMKLRVFRWLIRCFGAVNIPTASLKCNCLGDFRIDVVELG